MSGLVAVILGASVLLGLANLFCCFILSGRIAEQEEREAARELAETSTCIDEAVYGRPFPDRYDSKGRPQPIPAEAMARVRKGWDEATEAEPVEDSLRGTF